MCRNCKAIKRIRVSSGNSNITLPRKCDGGSRQAAGADAPKCPNDPFVPIPDASEYTNVQFLKLQESPEAVPTGEMPRHVNLSCERYLVGQVKPGTRITVVGVQMAFAAKRMGQDKKNGVNDVGIRIPYVRILSIEQDSDANDILLGKLTPEDQEEVQNLVNNSNDIYKDVASSIAPAIMGRDDIKKAIACALFGGSRKVLPDGMSLRGDINILLLGDPSVAKSQFLKFASQAAPIAVYTSGKGSSAAGLTASVIKNPSSGEFSLEGGALVLADGGMVCIDEFDKMRDQDRVAIHEAMEQQTISIAKAGITTILNSRTSVLAAANPVFGRYDDSKDASDNIDFQTTILSRFDLIFIIRDMQDEDLDRQLASHIIRVHAGGEAMVQEEHPDLISPDKLKKFIAYARRIQPRLNDEAAATLANHYVRFRQDMANNRRKAREDPNSTGAAQVIPITVRQLEAIVRISEAIARMSLSTVATPAHVEEALRLFNVATLQAAASPLSQVIDSPAFLEHVQRAEVCLTRGLPVGATVATREIMRKVISEGHDERAVKRAVDRMVGSQSLVFLNQRKMIRRHK
jgi:DNA replication licensing factor MCM5